MIIDLPVPRGLDLTTSTGGRRLWRAGPLHAVARLKLKQTEAGQWVVAAATTRCGFEVEWPPLGRSLVAVCRRCAR